MVVVSVAEGVSIAVVHQSCRPAAASTCWRPVTIWTTAGAAWMVTVYMYYTLPGYRTSIFYNFIFLSH